GLHRQLRCGRRSHHGGGADGLRFRGRPLRLSRPREGLGLLQLAQRRSSAQSPADVAKAAAGAGLTPTPHVVTAGSANHFRSAFPGSWTFSIVANSTFHSSPFTFSTLRR